MKKKTLSAMAIIILTMVFLSGCRLKREKISNNFNQPDNINKKQEINEIKPGDYKFIIKQKNTARYYLLHIPKMYNNNAIPLVLVFHGGMGTAEIMAENYGWKEKSDKEGFIVAFPNGANKLPSGKIATWNAGNCCGYAVESGSDDVGFVKLIIDDIGKKANVNAIFAAGMSNGGMLSHRLACDMADTFSAVASVSGTNNYDECSPKKSISVMHIHGLKDDRVLFEGGCGPACNKNAETEYVSVSDTVSQWVKRNNCRKESQRIVKNENAYCDIYSGCDNGTEVKLCVAEDGGHTWPGTTSSPNPLEKTTPFQAFSATDEVWDFFKNNK